MPILKFEVEADYQKVVKLREEIERLEDTLRGFGPGASDKSLDSIKRQISECSAEFQRLTAQAAMAGASVEKSVRGELGKIQKNQSVSIKMQADTTQFHNAMLESNRDFQDVMHNLDSFQNQLTGTFSKLSSLAGFSVPLYSAFAFLDKVKNTRSYFQDVESTMQVMLGSQEKALDFTKKLQDYAYYNMFEYSDLVGASKQMLAYGVAVEDVIPRLNTLSEVATATKQPIGEIVGMYNRAKSIGYVDSRALQTWASNGLVVKDVLAEMGERGVGTKVTFEQLNKALDHVTAEGGKFNGVMDAQMQNISAEIGQLEDNMSLMYNEIGENLQEPLRKVIKVAGSLVDNWKTVGAVLASAAVGYATFSKARSLSASALRKEHEDLKKSLSSVMDEEDRRQQEINRLMNEGVVSRERALEMQKQLNIAKGEEAKIDRALKAGLITEQEAQAMKNKVETARLEGLLSERGGIDKDKVAEMQSKRQSLLGDNESLGRGLAGATAEADLREAQINARLKEGLIDRKVAKDMQDQLNIAKQKELEIDDALSRGIITRAEAESMKENVEMARQKGILGKTSEEIRQIREQNIKAQEESVAAEVHAEAEEVRRLETLRQQNEEIREQAKMLEASNKMRVGKIDISNVETKEISDDDLLEHLKNGGNRNDLLELQHQRDISRAIINDAEEQRNKYEAQLRELDKKATLTYRNLSNAREDKDSNPEAVATYEKEWEDIQKAREEKIHKVLSANDRLNTLNAGIEGDISLKQRIAIKEDDLQQGEQRAQSLRNEAKALRDSIPGLKEKIAEEEKELEVLRKHTEELQKRHEEQNKLREQGIAVPVEEDVTNDYKDSKEDLQFRENQKKALEKNALDAAKRADMLDQNAISQEMMNAQMKKDIDLARKNGYSGALDAIDAQIDTERDKVNEIDKKISLLMAERKRVLSSDLENKQELIDENSRQLSEAYTERSTKIRDVAGLHKKRREVSAESGMGDEEQKMQDEYNASLSGKVDEQNKSLKALDEEIAKSRELLDTKQKELETAQLKTAELQKQVNDLPEGDNSQGAQDLNSQLATAATEERTALEGVKQMQDEINAKTQERMDMQEELTAMVTDMEIADAESLVDSMDSVTDAMQGAEDALESESNAEIANSAAKSGNEAATRGQVATNASKTGSEVAEGAAVRSETGAEVANTGAKKANTLSTRLGIVWDRIKKATVDSVTNSVRAMNAAFMANPIMAVVSVIGTLVTALMSFKAAAEETPTPEMDKYGESALNAKNNVESLFAVMQATESDSEAHKKAVAELEKQYRDKNIVLGDAINKEKEMIKNKERLIELIKEEGQQNMIANKIESVKQGREDAQSNFSDNFKIKGKTDTAKTKIDVSESFIEMAVMEEVEKFTEERKELKKLKDEYKAKKKVYDNHGWGDETRDNEIVPELAELRRKKEYNEAEQRYKSAKSAYEGKVRESIERNVGNTLGKQGLKEGDDYKLNMNKLIKAADEYGDKADAATAKTKAFTDAQEQLKLSGNKVEKELNLSGLAAEQLAKSFADAKKEGETLANTKIDPPVDHVKIDEVVESAIKAGGYINALGKPVKIDIDGQSVEEGSDKTEKLKDKLKKVDDTTAYPVINDASIQNALDKLGQVSSILNSINGQTYYGDTETIKRIRELEKKYNGKGKHGEGTNALFKDGKMVSGTATKADVKEYERLWSELKKDNYLAGNENYKINNAYEYAVVDNARKNHRNEKGEIDLKTMDEDTRKAYEDVIYNIHLRALADGKVKNDAIVKKQLNEYTTRYTNYKNMKDSDFDEANSYLKSYQSNFVQGSTEYEWAKKEMEKLKKNDERKKNKSGKTKSAEEIKYNTDKMVAEELLRRKRMTEDLYSAITDAEIEAMTAGTNKEIRTLQHNHQKKMRELERQKEDEIKKRKQALIQKWIAEDKNGKRKEYQFFNSAENRNAVNALEKQVEEDLQLATRMGIAEQKLSDALDDITTKNIKAYDEFLKTYGAYNDKVKAIEDMYEEELKETTDAVKKMDLLMKKNQELEELNTEEFLGSLNLDIVFETLDDRSLSSLEALEKNLKEALEKGISQGIPFDKLDELRDKIREIKNLISDRKNQWSDLLPDIVSVFVKPKLEQKRRSQRYTDAQEEYNSARAIKEQKQSAYNNAFAELKRKAEGVGYVEKNDGAISMENAGVLNDMLQQRLYEEKTKYIKANSALLKAIGQESLDTGAALSLEEGESAIKTHFEKIGKSGSNEEQAALTQLNSNFENLGKIETQLTDGMDALGEAFSAMTASYAELNKATDNEDRAKSKRDNAYELSPEAKKKAKEDRKQKQEEARQKAKEARDAAKKAREDKRASKNADKERDNALKNLNDEAKRNEMASQFDEKDDAESIARKLAENNEDSEKLRELIEQFLQAQGNATTAASTAEASATNATNATNASIAAQGAAEGAAEGAGASAGGGGASGAAMTDAIIHGVNQNVQSMVQLNEELGIEDSKFAEGMQSFAESSQYATDAFDSLKSGDIVGTAANLIGAFRTLGDALGKWGIGFFGSSDISLHDDMEHLAKVEEQLTQAVEGLTRKMSEKDTSVTEMLDFYYRSQQYIEDDMENDRELLRRSMQAYNNGFFGIGGKSSANTKVNREMEDRDWAKVSMAIGRTVKNAEDLSDLSAEDWYNLSLYDPETLVKIKEAVEKGSEGEAALEYIDKMIEHGEELEEITQQVQENLTQTSFDAVADNFKSILLDMSSDSYAFAENFQEMMKEAVINSMMQEEFNKRIKEWYDSFSEDMASGTELTAFEQQRLKEEYMSIVDDAVEKRDQIMGMMGWDGEVTQSSTRGAIAQMSQDTGDAIEGRMTAIQMATESIRGYEEMNSTSLALISDNVLQMMMQNTESINHFENVEEQIARCYMQLQAINDNTASLRSPLGNMQTDLAEIKRAIKNL